MCQFPARGDSSYNPKYEAAPENIPLNFSFSVKFLPPCVPRGLTSGDLSGDSWVWMWILAQMAECLGKTHLVAHPCLRYSSSENSAVITRHRWKETPSERRHNPCTPPPLSATPVWQAIRDITAPSVILSNRIFYVIVLVRPRFYLYICFTTCAEWGNDPVNTKHLYDIYTMLDQHRRRWADVVQNYIMQTLWSEKCTTSTSKSAKYAYTHTTSAMMHAPFVCTVWRISVFPVILSSHAFNNWLAGNYTTAEIYDAGDKIYLSCSSSIKINKRWYSG